MKRKKELCCIGKKMKEVSLVAACDGNISYRRADGTIIITPSGVPKGEIKKKDLLHVTAAGTLIEGNGKPSSEMALHIQIYKNRPDVNAIVHAHPVTATAVSIAGIPFPDHVVTEADLVLGHVPTIPYAAPGTSELAYAAAEVMAQANVALLARHGAVAVGDSLRQAFYRMETLETVAKMYREALIFSSFSQPEKEHNISPQELAALFHLE